ncbi:thiamine transporter 2-like [Vespa mandarinia]|uniref:thiamine transporter 2-like n=1 Tax=Vespa mandarinia TaxID=7446 RepID=UPI00160CBE03|nr:thiamine transporter 2-like [Vespa mandarinia]XP_035738626.1 thiamine transporter 2-like [Vespa mandarinia]XP_035738627.1 thiamine transporter 2-like [Vespa mandarinia]
MYWLKISFILCMFGLLKDFRPSESFVTDYLTGPWKNFTHAQVNQEIYPVSTYSYFLTLVIIFLITDFVRYKPIIILCSLSGMIAFLVLILAKTVPVVQITEFFYGLFLSSEVAYYTYIYAKVDKKHYQEVTGHTKAASLVGRCMAGIIAQLTASFHILDFHELNYLTIAAFGLATIWTFFLPSVGQSIYFHSPIYDQNITTAPADTLKSSESDSCYEFNRDKQSRYNPAKRNVTSMSSKLKHAYALLWQHFLNAYTHHHIVKWSMWWAFSTCGYLQITNYAQLLWQTAVESYDDIYNGAVDACYAIIGASTVFVISKIPFNWPVIGDVTLTLFALIEGGLIILCSYNYNIWVLYTAYIIFGVVYHTMVTVASFEVAKNISEDSYGLIFGTNIFLALLFQSLLTLVVINGNLGDTIRSQFFIYGCYYIILAVIFLIIAIFTIIKRYKNGDKFEIWLKNKNIRKSIDNIDNNESFNTNSTVSKNDILTVQSEDKYCVN